MFVYMFVCNAVDDGRHQLSLKRWKIAPTGSFMQKRNVTPSPSIVSLPTPVALTPNPTSADIYIGKNSCWQGAAVLRWHNWAYSKLTSLVNLALMGMMPASIQLC